MKLFYFILAFILLCASESTAQQTYTPITTQKAFIGYRFHTNGQKNLSPQEVIALLRTNPDAHALAQKARANKVFIDILGGAGGFMVGYPLGAALANGEPDWTLAGVGAGLILASVPFTIKYNKKIKEAVDTYNAGSPAAQTQTTSTSFYIGSTHHGIGLTLAF